MQTAVVEPKIAEELLQGKPYATLPVVGDMSLSLFSTSFEFLDPVVSELILYTLLVTRKKSK